MERHDAYNTFTELYTPLDNTLTYIAENSSEFTSDTVKKASSFLDGITEFQFIATLIIAKHILSTTQILSKSLQYRNAQDIVREWNHVKITNKRVKEIDRMQTNIRLLGSVSQLLWLRKLGKNHEFQGDVLDKYSEIMFLRPLVQSTTSEQYQYLCLIILKAK